MGVGFLLTVALLARLAESSDLEIILLSNMSYQTPSDVTNQQVDVLTGDNATFVARYRVNITGNVQIAITWFKDGKRFALSKGRTDVKCNFPRSQICSVPLAVLSINGNRSANYSAQMKSVEMEVYNASESAWISITIGNLTELNFTSHPPAVVDGSSGNSTQLQYLADGFPRPTYSLKCQNTVYSVNMSASGTFKLPPLQCISGLSCHAVASNGFGEPVSSPETVVVAENNCAVSQSQQASEVGESLIMSAIGLGIALVFGLATAVICRLKRLGKLPCSISGFAPDKWSLVFKLCPQHLGAGAWSEGSRDIRGRIDRSVGIALAHQQTERPAGLQTMPSANGGSTCYMEVDGVSTPCYVESGGISTVASDSRNGTCETQQFQSCTTPFTGIHSSSSNGADKSPLSYLSSALWANDSLSEGYLFDSTVSPLADCAGVSLSVNSPAAMIQVGSNVQIINNHYVMVGDNNKMYVGDSDRDFLTHATAEHKRLCEEPSQTVMGTAGVDSPTMPCEQPSDAGAGVLFCLEVAPTSHSSVPEAELFSAFKDQPDIEIAQPSCEDTRCVHCPSGAEEILVSTLHDGLELTGSLDRPGGLYRICPLKDVVS